MSRGTLGGGWGWGSGQHRGELIGHMEPSALVMAEYSVRNPKKRGAWSPGLEPSAWHGSGKAPVEPAPEELRRQSSS